MVGPDPPERTEAGHAQALGRLSGTRPLDPTDWLITDEAHAAQMALRDHLISGRRRDVVARDAAARPVAEELLDAVLEALRARPDYAVGNGRGGRTVSTCGAIGPIR